jgi:dipeptidyl aminopeptidase/acylaminoacyl peptidase
VRWARQEAIEWTGAEDWTIGGVLTYPLDYVEGQRYPLILQVHGGPEGISLDGWTTSATYPVDILAANGYMVLQPNYRGSAGRGVAFSKADHDDLGGTEYEDVLAGVDALIERGLVDGDRVGTGGWSYGGYFSAWAATRHSERFKAAVVAAGLTNWISFTGTTDIPEEMSIVHWNHYWWDNPQLHWERSPVAHINNAQTATLIAHGTADARVHPEQSIQLYTFLRMKGVPTELVLYPRQPHGLVDRAHQIDFAERVLGWFDKYVKQ